MKYTVIGKNFVNSCNFLKAKHKLYLNETIHKIYGESTL